MRDHLKLKLVALALVVLALTAACSSSRGAATGSPATHPTVDGHLTILAAASLTESFQDEQRTLRGEQPDLDLRYSFGGSGALAQQVLAGAPADVVATADTTSMDSLVAAGLVDEPRTFARNKLAILVRSGNPRGIHSLADLARPDLTVVLCDADVPAGRYTTQILEKAGVVVHPRSLEPDVKAAVNRVTMGEADATIVYVTDVAAAGSKAALVEIPDRQNVIAQYPIAVVTSTAHRAAAEAFVAAVVEGSGQDALRTHGFLPPT